MPLDLSILPDKPVGSFNLDLDNLPDKPGVTSDVIGEDIFSKIGKTTMEPLARFSGISPKRLSPLTLNEVRNKSIGYLGGRVLDRLNVLFEPVERVFHYPIASLTNKLQEGKPFWKSVFDSTASLRSFEMKPEQRVTFFNVMSQYEKDLNRLYDLPENYSHPSDKPFEIVGGLALRFAMPDVSVAGKVAIKSVGKAAMNEVIDTLQLGKEATVEQLTKLANYFDDLKEYNKFAQYVRQKYPTEQAEDMLKAGKEIKRILETTPVGPTGTGPATSVAQQVIPGIQAEVSLPARTVGELMEQGPQVAKTATKTVTPGVSGITPVAEGIEKVATRIPKSEVTPEVKLDTSKLPDQPGTPTGGEMEPQKTPKYITVSLTDEDKTILAKIKEEIGQAQPGHKYVTWDEFTGEVARAGYEPSDFEYIPYWPKGWAKEPVLVIIDNALAKGKLTEKQKNKLDNLLYSYKEVVNAQSKLEEELKTEGIQQSEINEAKRAGEEEANSIAENVYSIVKSIEGLPTEDLEKLIDERYASGASQEELDLLETVYDSRISEDEASIAEEEINMGEETHQGAGLEEQLINMYHRYLHPGLRSGMEEKDILNNMRSAIETYGGKKGITDEQILVAAKELYENKQKLLAKQRSKSKKFPVKKSNLTPSGEIRQELKSPQKKDLFQEEGELFKKAKPGSHAFAMPPGGLAEWMKKQEEEQQLKLNAIEMPELVKLAIDLSGQTPVVKKLITNLGLFKFGKGITLDVKIFKNARLAGMVLAHEIGHLIDWLPDYTLKRGNILGRIASLKGYLKHLLPESPQSQFKILTQKDRDRLRREAMAQLKEESKLGEREIIEEIIKEIPIYKGSLTADDVLRIWKDKATEIRDTNKALYDFVAGLSSAEKKSIIKQAMQGIIDERLAPYGKGERVGTKTIKETVRRVITPEEITPNAISKRFKQLLEEEIRKRKLFREEVIKEELKRVTQWWNPFDDSVGGWYRSYRYSGEELYAEAISVMLNQPEKLQELAPQFYKAFWNYIDAKPEVKEALLSLQQLLNMGVEEKLKSREQDIRSMFKSAEEEYLEARNRYKLNKKDIKFLLMTELIDKNWPILEKIKQEEKLGHLTNPDDNPKYYFEEYNYKSGKIANFLDTVNTDIINILNKDDLTSEDLGEYLLLNRIVFERREIANPLGHNPATAQAQLGYSKEYLGENKMLVLERLRQKFLEITRGILAQAHKEGLIRDETYQEIIKNPAYATFQVLDYVDEYISPSIIKQIGTLKGVANPFTATILKNISTIRAIERNIVNKSVVRFLNTIPGEIEKAKLKRYGKYKVEIPEKEGKGIIKVRNNGNLEGYYVDPYIADSINYQPAMHTNAVLSVFRFLNSSYFRPVYISLNLNFQVFNLVRDFIRAWKLNPSATFPTMLKKYWESIPIARRRVWGNFSDPIIKEMQQQGMLSITYNDFLKGAGENDEKELDYLLHKFGIIQPEAGEPKTFLQRFTLPIKSFFQFIENVGNFIETIPKIAGYLTRLKSGMPMKEIAHQVRVFSGSPDFLRKGKGYDWYNNVFLFSNAIKEGVRGDMEGAFKNPRTRTGYWWRTIKIDLIPTIIKFLATLGFFGISIKTLIDKATEYDKTNYNILPLGETEVGKAIYIRIPHDEMGRVLSGILWKTLNFNKEDVFKSIQDVSSPLGGQIPSITPVIELISAWSLYFAGKNPYDWFRGTNVLTDDEQTAGGWYALEKMGKYTAVKGGIYPYQLMAKEERTGFEKVMSFLPIVSRFLRITDYGEEEQRREEMQDYYKRRSIYKLERRK